MSFYASYMREWNIWQEDNRKERKKEIKYEFMEALLLDDKKKIQELKNEYQQLNLLTRR